MPGAATSLVITVPAFSTVTAGALLPRNATQLTDLSFTPSGPESSFVGRLFIQQNGGPLNPDGPSSQLLIDNLRGSYDAPPAPLSGYRFCNPLPPPPVRLAARITNQCCLQDVYVITAQHT